MLPSGPARGSAHVSDEPLDPYDARVIVIFGTKGYREVLATVMLVCSVCHNPAAQRIEKLVTKFTLFFIPLFPVSTRHQLQCAMCAATSSISAEEAERLAAGTREDRAGRPADHRELGR